MRRKIGLTTKKNYRLMLYIYSLVIVLLGISLAGFALVCSLPSNLGEGYHNIQAMLRGVQQILFWRISVLFIVSILLIVIAIVILNLLYSHRIAGPAYRIGLEAAKITKGNLSGTIIFRKNDNLMDMADYMNDITLKYHEHIRVVQEFLSEIEERAHNLETLIRQEKNEGAIKLEANGIAEKCNAIAVSLAEIKT